MGGEPWFHVAPYQSDIPAALEALRRRVDVTAEELRHRGTAAGRRHVAHPDLCGVHEHLHRHVHRAVIA